MTSKTAKTKKPIPRKVKFLLFGIALAVLLPAGYWLYMDRQGNFHAIEPNQAYRSGQLNADRLAHYISKYDIKSILNLRGENPDKPWYIDETEVCQKYNVAHYDIAISSRREPSPDKVARLLDIFENAPRPVLIHCQGGADRSSLAAAMWQVAVNGRSKEQAKKQLSIFYGHIPFGKTAAMDNFFDKWYSQYNQIPEQTLIPQPTGN